MSKHRKQGLVCVRVLLKHKDDWIALKNKIQPCALYKKRCISNKITQEDNLKGWENIFVKHEPKQNKNSSHRIQFTKIPRLICNILFSTLPTRWILLKPKLYQATSLLKTCHQLPTTLIKVSLCVTLKDLSCCFTEPISHCSAWHLLTPAVP